MHLLRNPIVGPRLSPFAYYFTAEVLPRWQQYCALEYSNEAHAREGAARDSKGGKTVEVLHGDEVIGRYVDGVDRFIDWHAQPDGSRVRYAPLCVYCEAGGTACGRGAPTQTETPAR